MNFKDEYKRDFDNIKPDDDFKRSLVNQLNAESQLNGKPAKKAYKKVYVNVLAAAAALLLVVGVGYFAGTTINNSESGYDSDSRDDKDKDHNDKSIFDFVFNFDDETKGTSETVEIEQETTTIGIELPSELAGFPGGNTLYESWYGDAVTDEEIYEVFVSLISGDTLDMVYGSSTELFNEDDILDKSEVGVLLESISNGELTDEAFIGKKTYYKAVLEDGTIIGFVISDAGYLKINGRNAVFKVEK